MRHVWGGGGGSSMYLTNSRNFEILPSIHGPWRDILVTIVSVVNSVYWNWPMAKSGIKWEDWLIEWTLELPFEGVENWFLVSIKVFTFYIYIVRASKELFHIDSHPRYNSKRHCSQLHWTYLRYKSHSQKTTEDRFEGCWNIRVFLYARVNMRRTINTCEILPWYSQAHSSHIILSIKLGLHIRLSLIYRKRLQEEREGRFQRKVSSAMDFRLLISTHLEISNIYERNQTIVGIYIHDVHWPEYFGRFGDCNLHTFVVSLEPRTSSLYIGSWHKCCL